MYSILSLRIRKLLKQRSQQQSGTFGAILIITGLVGAGLGGAIVDKTHAYKATILASLAIGAGTMVAFRFFFKFCEN